VTRTRGQAAYETYCEAVGGVRANGEPCCTWEELPERIQLAWEAVGALHENG
jgi:hypothetical protein